MSMKKTLKRKPRRDKYFSMNIVHLLILLKMFVKSVLEVQKLKRDRDREFQGFKTRLLKKCILCVGAFFLA